MIEEGLRDAGLIGVTAFADRHGIAARLEVLSPDVVRINLANPRLPGYPLMWRRSNCALPRGSLFTDLQLALP